MQGHQATLLHTQYRCHPDISAIANELFYERQLKDGITSHDRPALAVCALFVYLMMSSWASWSACSASALVYFVSGHLFGFCLYFSLQLSLTIVVCQVFLGQPAFKFHFGCNVRAIKQWVCFLSTCPTHFHILFLIKRFTLIVSSLV